MDFNGEIVFAVADFNYIDVDFGVDFLPTKIIKKGDQIALGREASQYRWLYAIKFDNQTEYIEKLETITNQLYERRDYVTQLINKYKEVSIDVFIRSDFAEIGYSLPSNILKKVALLGCAVNFEIFSFGMALDKE